MGYIFVYITNPSKSVAKKVAECLIKKKLIACANIFQTNSLYRWKGRIADEKEFNLIAKTTSSKFEAVKREVEKIHPYAIPCITKIPVSFNKEYAKWIERSINLK
ncbi:MAG TPA: divalent-cation tolerance protein CutA [archaeon]|nr:divalent-cation tolerance protein CutA [archaeon]